jgi:hypothetical protein
MASNDRPEQSQANQPDAAPTGKMPQEETRQGARQERLAQALRANLSRRKAQQRARKGAASGASYAANEQNNQDDERVTPPDQTR